MSQIITGLDIGSAQIKCVVAERKKDGSLSIITAFKQPSQGLRKGMMVDVEDVLSFLRNVVLDLRKVSKRAAQNVFVNVNSEHIKARPSRGIVAVSRADQEIQSEDVDRVIEASRAVKLSPNYLVLHNIVKEYFVDEVGDITDPLGMTGNRLETSTLIIEGFAPQSNMLVRNLEKVGFRIGGLIFNPLAAGRAVLTKRQRDLGVLMIDFGFGTTSLAVYEENKILHTKSLPVGAGYVTNDIAIGLKTSIEAAEKLKIMYGFALARNISRRDTIDLGEIDASVKSEVSKRFLGEIIEIRLAEILDLVNNEIKVLGRSVQMPAGVVVTGGGVKLAGLTELVRQELRLPVQIGYPNLQSFEILNSHHQELLEDPEFAVALGLVLWGGADGKLFEGGAGAIKNFFRNLIP